MTADSKIERMTVEKYTINGMTCGSCKKAVEAHLLKIKGVSSVVVSLEDKKVSITSKVSLTLERIQQALPEKFTVIPNKNTERSRSKVVQLKPLFLILTYIGVASILLHFKNWNWSAFMLDFMGLFYIVFSFFKMLDLKGFEESFRMYDPLAKQLPIYATFYPFIETVLGLLLLMRFQLALALIATLIVLGITTIGVTKTLLGKKTIQCACLGTALKLPMTEATFIENALMIVMAVFMLLLM